MSVVFSCGFSRVVVKESFHKPGGVGKEMNPDQRWKNYHRLLEESALKKLAVDIYRTLYMKKSRNIFRFISENESPERGEYLHYFSLKNWKVLPKPQNSEHIMWKCGACQIHNFAQLSFEKKVPFFERHQAEATKAGSKCLAENAFKANNKVKR